MKKEASKKSKLWLWLLIAIVAVVAVAGVVLALVLGGGSGDDVDEGPKGGRADLYWNIDRKTYTENSLSGLSTREPGEDGIYRVRFAYNGGLVELVVADKQLINYIDTMDCMGIVQDADGTVIDVVDPKTLATETAKMFYVSSAEGSTIVLNSSMAMNGMNMQIELKEVTEIYDVAPGAEEPGKKLETSALKPMDAVTVYSNDLGEATHVYVVSHPVESPVYWRADTGFYSSANKETTRVPDENGYYTIPFYVNGEYVELKCNVKGIVSTIDAKNRFKAHTGLVLDEEGHIVDNMLAATGIRGLLGCEMYDVTEVNGKTFTAEALLAGSGDTYTNTLTDDAVIYDVSLQAKPDVRGKAVSELKIGDRIVVFENAKGEAVLVFVGQRLIDGPLYFNMTKKYSSANKSTTRKPDGNGWYYIELFSEGVTKNYKTQDKSIVDYIDSQNNRGVYVELDGDVITYAYPGESVAGYGPYVGYTIQNVTGSILSIAPSTTPENVINRIMNAECKVYNMSGVKQKKGEITELQPGDYCILWRNARSEIVYIYVIRRLVNAPVYFSVTRKWDSTNQSTTRKPDEDGWYVYDSIKLGTKGTVKLKTKSKSVADFLDSQSPQTFAVLANADGVIYEYYETAAVYGGSRSNLNNVVKRLSPLVTYYSETKKTYTPKVAEDVKIYNMSTAFERFRGEPTTLQLNDNIQCYTNAKGEIAMIMVRQRKVVADIYFSKNRVKTVDENGNTTRQPDADGWYVFECAKNGKEVTVKTKDLAVATFLDAQSPQSFALKVDENGVIQKAYATTAATGGSTRALNAVVKSVDGGKIIVTQTNGTEFEMPMASKYKVYNVSSVIENNFGEATTIKVGDTLQSYTDASNKVTLVFVKVRPGAATTESNWKLAWVVDPQYDATNKVTTRTPDADGYYHVDLSVDGVIKTYKTKARTEGELLGIDYVDQSGSGNRAVSICLTAADSLEFTEAMGATNNTGAKGAKVVTLTGVNGNVVTATGYEGTILENAKIYDVSAAAAVEGEVTTLKTGDYVRFYTADSAGTQILYGFVITRESASEPVETWKMAWVVDPKFDDTNKVTTRTPDADGYYYIELSIDGVTKTYKTKATGLDSTGNGIDYADQFGFKSRPVSVCLTDVNSTEFTEARSATYKGYVGAKGAKVGTIAAVNGSTVTLGTEDIAVAADAKIYNVSDKARVEGEATIIAEGDTIRAYTDANGALLYVYVTARTAEVESEPVPTWKMAWNVDPQYDTASGKTSRTPDADGYYFIDLTIDGVTKTYKTKVDDATYNINYMDKTASGSNPKAFTVYLNDLDGDEILEIKSGANADVGTKGAKVGPVTAVNGNTVTVDTTNVTVAADAKIYNVSDKATVEGEVTTIMVGDTIRAYTDADGALLYVYIVARTAEVEPEPVPTWKLAWVVDPQYNEAETKTTRTPDADGYYFIELSIDGVTKTYKTKATGLDSAGNGIDYADQSGSGNRPVSVYLTDVNSTEFTEARSATHGGFVGAKGAKVTYVKTISGSEITMTDDSVLKLAAGANIFDVSKQAAVEGEVSELRVGDYARFYTDVNGDILYAYIYTRVVVEELDMNTVCQKADAMASVFATDTGAGVEAECPVCQKTVLWTAMPAISGTTKLTSGHYYFASDVNVSAGYYSISNSAEAYEVCINLNGKTFENTGTGNTRSFYVDYGSKLNIMGSGNIIGARGTTTAAERCGSTLEITGADSVVNLCGGTWSKTQDTLDVIGVRTRENGGLNIYDGTVINIGTVQGNALWAAGGKINLCGGEINGNVMIRNYKPGSVTFYPVDVTFDGITINGQVNYNTDHDNKITSTVQGDTVIAELVPLAEFPVYIGRLTTGADIKVTADGAFTAANLNAQNYVDDGFISAKAEGKTLAVSEEGVISVVEAPKAYDNSNLVFEEGTTKAMCPWCGEVKDWTAIEPDGNGTQIDLADGGHYYLANDLLNNTSAISSNVTNACVHLNGHKIETVGNYAFILQLKKGLTIMGNGEVSSSGDSVAATISSAGTLNLVGGTYSCGAADKPVIKHTRSNYAVSVYQDAIINGNDGVQGSAINYTYGNFNLYGGTINGNIYIHGNNGSSNVISKVVIDGGIIDGGLQVAHAHSTSFLNISGAPVITAKNGGLNYCNKITIERLTKGAEIYVTAADGEIAKANDRAADYLEYGYIKAAVAGKNITEKDGVLSIG